ncbi:MAG: hypothetical protein ACOC5T_08540, partial [Elusimicrobiota bacterium]
MDFGNFYYLDESVSDTRKSIWDIILKSGAIDGLDIYTKSGMIKPTEDAVKNLLRSKSFLLYVRNPDEFRFEKANQFNKKLMGKDVKTKFYQKGRRPVVEVTKDNNTLTFGFKDNISGKVRAVDYENAIVQSWNNEPLSKEQISKQAKSIVNQLRKKIKSDVEASHTGSLRLSKEALSEFWREGVDKPNTTPKPDFNIDGEKYRISLKIGTAAQLCSSKIIGAEGSKLIINALNKSGVSGKVRDRIEEMISNRSERISGNREIMLSKGTRKDRERLTMEEVRQFHNELTDLLEEASNQTGSEFKKHFVFEAMSGEEKFRDVRGTANYMLAAPYDGSFINFKNVRKVNFDKIVPQIKLYVAFKSGKSGTFPWSVVRAEQPIFSDSVEYGSTLRYFEEKAEEIGIDHKTLNEGIIGEGLLDWFKKIFNIIKDAVKKGIDFVMKLFNIEPKIENLN